MTDQPFDPNSSPGDVPGQFSQRIRHEQVSARVPEDVARGVFATGALVLNGPHEFIIDFLQSITRPHQVVARIVLPTTIMQSMVRAMQQNLDNYAKRFGPIPELPNPQSAANAAAGQQAGAQFQPDPAQQPGPGGESGGEQQTPGASTEAGGPGAAAGPGLGSTEAGGQEEAAPDAVQAGQGGSVQPPPAPSVEEIYNQLKLPDDVATGAYANTVMITHSPAEFCFDFITSFYPRSTVAARIFMSASQVPRVHATLSRSFEQFKQKVIEQRRRARQQPPQAGDEGDLRNGGDAPETRE